MNTGIANSHDRIRLFSFALLALCLWASTHATADSPKSTRSDRDNAALRTFPELNRAARDVSPILDRAARDHAEVSAQRATSNSATVTSRDRPSNSPLASRAHDRGAIDVTTPNMRRDAARISKETGAGYTTIHETPVRPKSGAAYDSHAIYQAGSRVNTTANAPRATAEHIHVQPEFNKRLHDAVSPPKTRSTEGTMQSSGRGVR